MCILTDNAIIIYKIQKWISKISFYLVSTFRAINSIQNLNPFMEKRRTDSGKVKNSAGAKLQDPDLDLSLFEML